MPRRTFHFNMGEGVTARVISNGVPLQESGGVTVFNLSGLNRTREFMIMIKYDTT